MISRGVHSGRVFVRTAAQRRDVLWKKRKGVRCQAVTERVGVDGLRLPKFGMEQLEYDIMDQNYDIESWASAFDVVEEVPDGYWVENVEGEIPIEIRGTYIRNGPGEFDFVDEPVEFSYDANGIIASIAIKDGKAFYRSRFAKTEESLMEEKAGKRLFRGVFGTIPKQRVLPFRMFTPRNAANGKPFVGNGKLYVPYEGSPVTELDPFTLETLYPTMPGGSLSTVLQTVLWPFSSAWNVLSSRWVAAMGPSQFLKPRSLSGLGDSNYDGRRKHTICHNYRADFSTLSHATEFKFFEFDDNLESHSEQVYTLDTFGYAHTIGVSENYYVLNKFPVKFNMEKAWDPTGGLIHAIDWDSNGDHEFHLIPRPNKNRESTVQPRICKVKEATFVYHFINVFEEDGKVVIDAIHYPRYPNYKFDKETGETFKTRSTVNQPIPRWRRSICLPDGEVETEEISTRCLELPSINPNSLGRRYQYAYFLIGLHPSAHLEPQAIAKLNMASGNMDVWTKGTHYFAGEPLFVPRNGAVEEDDGWVMSFCYNGQTKKTEFVILDARNLQQGPIATLYLNHAISHGFHAIWTDTYYGL